MTWEVVEAKEHHVGAVLHRLRPAHAAYMRSLGLNAHRELRRAFQDSAWRRSWLHDGRPVAIGGVSGSLLSPVGYIWLAITDDAVRFPVRVMREARRQIGLIMETRIEIQSLSVLCDPTAWKFALALGFCAKTPDGVHSVTPDSHKTSAVDILQRWPEFRMSVPGYGDGILVSYGGSQ
jgi:hypothetical protein